MTKSILSSNQKKFLNFFISSPDLRNNFYLTGGTCLSEFYLHHRYSEDLDFFSEKEIDIVSITSILKKSKNSLYYKKIDFQKSFNRNIFQLIFDDKNFLKIELTYFPFEAIDKRVEKNYLTIDSLKDIAVNKLFTIIQNPRGRDYYDLFFIFKKTNFDFNELLKLARIKFDYQIDYLTVGSQLIKFSELKDDPIIIDKKNYFNDVEKFFYKLAQKFKNKIIK